jgi:hypothetical protein
MAEIFELQVKELWKKPSAQELKLLKPEEPNWIMTVRSKNTCVDRSCILGESTLRESECDLRILKAEVQKWTRAGYLRRPHGRRSAISKKSHPGRKKSVLNRNSRRPESQSSPESFIF